MRVPNITSTPTSLPVQNDTQIEDDSSIAHYHLLSERVNELTTKVEELTVDQKNRLCRVENLIKDNNQKDKKILELEGLVKELTEKTNKNSKSSSNFPVKNNTFYNLNDPAMHNLIYRAQGVGDWEGKGDWPMGRNAIMIEFVSPFPKKFTLDIKGIYLDYSQEPYEIYIGKFNEKRHKQESQPFGSQRNYASVLFDTEDEDNNTLWIVSSRNNNNIRISIKSINIIPRK